MRGRVSIAVGVFAAVLLALSVLPIVGWLVAFPNHFLVHAWFMDRILVWPVAAGFSLFLMAITTRYAITPVKPSNQVLKRLDRTVGDIEADG